MYHKNDGVDYELVTETDGWVLRPTKEEDRKNAYGEEIGFFFSSKNFSCKEAVECHIKHYGRYFTKVA